MPKAISLKTVREIKKDLGYNLTFKQIADRNSVSSTLVLRINRRECYKDVERFVTIDLLTQIPNCPFRGTEEILSVLRKEARRRKGK